MNDAHLYARGPYRVVELDDRPRPFIVVDTAGAWLHEDPSLEGARTWVDQRIALDQAPPVPPPVQHLRRRR